jgi:hypothetical protein
MKFSLASFVILAAIAVPAVAQTALRSGDDKGSFRGRIVDADTGQPVTEDGVTIVVTKEGESDATRRVIDIKGEFVVPDLSLGRYRVQFRYKGIETGTLRYVQVTGFPPITPADIYLRLPGEITGVVVDENGEPVQGSQVMLVTMEYLGGQAIYTVFTSGRQTNDRGNFNLSTRVEAGRPYFLLVLPPEGNTPTLSGTPSLEPIWYPGRPGVVQPFVIGSAEKKRLDFVMEKKPTHCVDGTLTAKGLLASRTFEIAIPELGGYRGTTGGTQGVISRGQSDASGRFQACGLWQGEFVIAAGMNKPPTETPTTQFVFSADSYGRTTVSIVDRDVHDVRLNVQSPVTLTAQIRLDNPQTSPTTYRLDFIPLSRVAFEGQPFLSKRMDVVVPSQFPLSLLPSTDYMIALRSFDGSDVYLKEVACGGTVRRNSLKLGDSDCGLQITVGTDLGKLSAKILDKDNKSDVNALVCVSSTSAVTREEIALTGTCSSPDRGTTSVSIALRPDRYMALAVPPATVDWLEYFVANRGQAQPIDIKAGATVELTLKSSQGR